MIKSKMFSMFLNCLVVIVSIIIVCHYSVSGQLFNSVSIVLAGISLLIIYLFAESKLNEKWHRLIATISKVTYTCLIILIAVYLAIEQKKDSENFEKLISSSKTHNEFSSYEKNLFKNKVQKYDYSKIITSELSDNDKLVDYVIFEDYSMEKNHCFIFSPRCWLDLYETKRYVIGYKFDISYITFETTDKMGSYKKASKEIVFDNESILNEIRILERENSK